MIEQAVWIQKTFVTSPEKQSVYIAGPMRGFPQFNFPAFDDARDRFRANGWNVVSPADIDRAHDPATESMSDAQVSTVAMQRMYAARDIAAIFYVVDAVAALPGWEKSVGASAEVALARWIKKPVLNALTGGPL